MADQEKQQEEQQEAKEEALHDDADTQHGNDGDDHGSDDAEDSVDKHGHPGISKGKYMRDLAEKDAEIEKLRAQIDEASKSDEARKVLQEQIDALKNSQSDMQVEYELKLAGCKNNKAAKALLDDFEGDIEKLKEAEPWMFETKPQGSTGLKGSGATDTKADAIARARKAAGLPPKKEE